MKRDDSDFIARIHDYESVRFRKLTVSTIADP